MPDSTLEGAPLKLCLGGDFVSVGTLSLLEQSHFAPASAQSTATRSKPTPQAGPPTHQDAFHSGVSLYHFVR